MSDRRSELDVALPGRFAVGCVDLGPDAETYFNQLSALEYQSTFFQPPKEKALKKLMASAPAGFTFAVKAWQVITHLAPREGYPRMSARLPGELGRYGHFQPSTELHEAYQRLAAAATVLEAKALVFETPPSFTPSAEHRKWMAEFFSRIDRAGRLCVWAPRGLWPPSERYAIAEDLGLVAQWDPTVDDPDPSQGVTYCRVLGLGEHRKLTEASLARIAERLGQYPSAFCIFEGPSMLRDAAHLAALLA